MPSPPLRPYSISLHRSCCYVASPEFVGLITLRMLQLTLSYGLCNETSFSFATYAMLQNGIFNDTKAGRRFAQLSLTILNKSDAKEWAAKVHALVYFFGAHNQYAISSYLDKFQYGYQIGMDIGDLEYAMYNLLDFAISSFHCGRSLLQLQDEMKLYHKRMTECNQPIPLSFLSAFWQSIQNLMGHSSNPLYLTGDVFDEAMMINHAEKEGNVLLLQFINYNKLMLAYMFGNFENAVKEAAKGRNLVTVRAPGMFVVANFTFYDGLASCALAVESNLKSVKRSCLKTHKIAKSKMKTWSKMCPENFSQKYLLLKAEGSAVKGKNDKAKNAYEAAIAAAKKNNYIHDEALAYERAALFSKNVGEEIKASRYLARSQQLYLAWGAKEKSTWILAKYPAMVEPAKSRASFKVFMQSRCASVSPGDF